MFNTQIKNIMSNLRNNIKNDVSDIVIDAIFDKYPEITEQQFLDMTIDIHTDCNDDDQDSSINPSSDDVKKRFQEQINLDRYNQIIKDGEVYYSKKNDLGVGDDPTDLGSITITI